MDTLGEWSDGDDDWVFEVQIPIEYQALDTHDEIIRNIPEEMFRNIPEASDSDSEVEQSRRSRAVSETSEEEESVPETQTGRGEKRKNDSDDVPTGEKYYEIVGKKSRRSKKFKAASIDTEIRFTNVVKDMDIIESRDRTYKIFEQLLSDVTEGMNDRDQVRFVLRSNQLDKPISIPSMPKDRLTTERVFAAVEKVVQSNQEFRLNDTVSINIFHVEMPEGSGRMGKRTDVEMGKHLRRKDTVVCIKNKDDLCLVRAIVVAIARTQGADSTYYKQLRKSDCMEKREAKELHRDAFVPLGPCGLEEVAKFQRYLDTTRHYRIRYQIYIISADHANARIYPPTPPTTEKTPINLYLHNNHYDVITKMPGFFNSVYYCYRCHKAYSHKFDHLCDAMCRSCRAYNCYEGERVECDVCKRAFKSRACYDRHKVRDNGTKSICDTIHKCLKCLKSMDKRKFKSHECGTKCHTCKVLLQKDDTDHKCYIRPTDPSDESNYDQMYFFDFECRQETGEHIANFCVVQDEKGNEEIFKGENTIEDFCKWVFRKDHKRCIFVAHNFKSYDGYLIQNYLNKNAVQYDVICEGAKIVTLTVKEGWDIKFIDSLCFIPMRLADFPKTFGMNELCKGYFPHMFNTIANQNYVGPMPEKHHYCHDNMKPEDREKFLTWYDEQIENNYVFDFQKEMESYCRSDVDIMRKCCLKFREMLQEVTDGIDPFNKCVTIAGVCHEVYRTNYLEENTIAVFDNYRQMKILQSIKATKWLSWLAEKEGIAIEHGRNGGERRVGRYSLDGYCEETHTAYEFQGCFWHGKNDSQYCLSSTRYLCFSSF